MNIKSSCVGQVQHILETCHFLDNVYCLWLAHLETGSGMMTESSRDAELQGLVLLKLALIVRLALMRFLGSLAIHVGQCHFPLGNCDKRTLIKFMKYVAMSEAVHQERSIESKP